MKPNLVCVPISVGELIDKVSILTIKRVMISDSDKLVHVKKELMDLMDMAKYFLENREIEELFDLLVQVNRNLWEVEDALRQMENDEDFGSLFVLKARSVYRLNDRRYTIKTKINAVMGSSIIEVKSHPDYS